MSANIKQFLYGNVNPFMGAEILPLDLQGWNSESPVFARLIRETSARKICEIGTWKGVSAIHMSKLLATSAPAEIVCVDTWLGSLEFYTDLNKRGLLRPRNGRPTTYETFLSNVVRSGQQDVIVPFPTTSILAAKVFKHIGAQFDLIYIDASHETDDVIQDIQNYKDLAPVIFGDDWDWPSVRFGVECVAGTFGFAIETEGEKWILRKG